MSLVALGAVAFVVALVLMWKRKKWRRVQSVLMVIAGLSVSGSVGRVRDHISAWSQDTSAKTGSHLFGTAVPYVIAAVIVGWWVLDMDFDGLVNRARGRRGGGGEKEGGGNKHKVTVLTPWLGLLVPLSVAVLPGLGALPDQARHGLTALASMIG